jgi:ribosomal protein L32
MRHTSGHTRNRRSHHALDAVKAVAGEKEGTLRLPHRLDEATGLYRGKQIMMPKVQTAKEAPPSGTHHEHVAQPIDHSYEDHEHAEQTQAGAKGLVGKLTHTARPRSRSGMGGGV